MSCDSSSLSVYGPCALLGLALCGGAAQAACIRPTNDPADYCATGRPETGAYLGNRRASDTLFVHSLDDRLKAAPSETDHGIWLRAGGQGFKSTSDSGRFTVDGHGEFAQLGGNFFEWLPQASTGALSVGGLIGYGSARNDASAVLNPLQARGTTSGVGAGLFATWYQDRQTRLGWYADWWGQFGWFDDKVDRQGLRQVDYRSHVGMTSIEAGYAFRLADAAWTLQPQGQLVYVHNHAFNITQSDGAEVDGAKRGGWMSRLGIRAAGPAWQAAGMGIRPYATLNWWHDQLGDEVGLTNQYAVKDLFPSERIELKAGADIAFAQRWSAWGDVGVQTGSQSYRAWTARAGVKYRY